MGYGAADTGLAAVELMLQLYLLEFYTSVVGLPPGLAGIALALAVIWDALTDPLMGEISDRTRSRFGMRRPYILLGGIVLAAAFAFMFHPPALASDSGKFIYLLLCYVAVNTGMTIISVPHMALAGELSFDPGTRTKLFGWRMGFRLVGSLFGAVLPGVLAAQATETAALQSARAESSTLVAGVVLLSAFATLAALRGRDPDNRGKRRPDTGSAAAQAWTFVFSIGSVLRSPMFLPLVAGFVIAEIGRTINASLGLYFYKIRLEFSEEDFTLVFGVLMLAIAASMPMWVYLSKRFGKKGPAFAGAFALGLFTAVAYPLMPPGVVWIPVVFAGIGGGLMAGSIILLESLVADIVDYDELKTGEHREGLYYGCWMLARKLSRAIGLAATGGLLEWTGYQEGAATQGEAVSSRITWLFGPVVGICFIAGALVFLAMPLTARKHHRVQALLTRRRKTRARLQDTPRNR